MPLQDEPLLARLSMGSAGTVPEEVSAVEEEIQHLADEVVTGVLRLSLHQTHKQIAICHRIYWQVPKRELAWQLHNFMYKGKVRTRSFHQAPAISSHTFSACLAGTEQCHTGADDARAPRRCKIQCLASDQKLPGHSCRSPRHSAMIILRYFKSYPKTVLALLALATAISFAEDMQSMP